MKQTAIPPNKGMLKIITILPFDLFCNAMSSTVFTCLVYASSFFVEYESQYILQQPGSLKNLVMPMHMYLLGCWYYN